MLHDSDFEDVLRELASLPKADRRAILKRLSSSERQALRRARRQARLSPEMRALSDCSPALAKHLLRIVQMDESRSVPGVTEASRQALRRSLALPPSGHTHDPRPRSAEPLT